MVLSIDSMVSLDLDKLDDFLPKITEISGTLKSPLWYRGEGKASYETRPSLYRRNPLADWPAREELEQKSIAYFKSRGIPYVEIMPGTDMECLPHMQHYGIPTRLLDFTENPLFALYFALSDSLSSTNGTPDEDSKVVLVNPELWNTKHHAFIKPDLPVPELMHTKSRSLSPGEVTSERALAVFAPHANRRITAQRGTFMIFGTLAEHLEAQCQFIDDCLAIIRVKQNNISDIFEQLLKLGITESTVYPDMKGFAQEIRIRLSV